MFFYIFSNLPRFQNMHAYRVTKETDIFEFVHTSDPAIPGPPRVPETYQVSKELVSYLETLVAFTPYYKADDPRMSGKMEAFYAKAMERYKPYTYKEFHEYISRKMTNFFKKHVPPDADVDEEDKAGSGAEGNVVHVGALDADAIVILCRYRLEDDGEEVPGTRDKDYLLGQDEATAEDDAAAVKAATERRRPSAGAAAPAAEGAPAAEAAAAPAAPTPA